MNKIERRFVGSTLELRGEAEGDKMPTVRAYALTYGAMSVNLGSTRYAWYETIERGAAKDTVADLNNEIVGLFNHDQNYILGTRHANTLRVGDDDIGVWFEADLPATTWARDLAASIKRGDIRGCSFAFETLTQKWEVQDGKEVRRVIKLNLRDVSLVTFPAYPSTNGTVSMRAITGRPGEMTASEYEELRAVSSVVAPDTMATLNLLETQLRFKEKTGLLLR